LALLFLASFTLHAIGGTGAFNEEQLSHGPPQVSTWEYLAVAVLMGASVYLRERGSPESKHDAEQHYETGS